MSYGVRFVGKDPDGIAKAITVNDDGVLQVELLESSLVGEVAENPTANTILGRMKSLESKIDTLDEVIDSILAKIIASPATEAKQDTLISHVDGVEAALATLLTKAGFDAKADISLTALRDALRGTGSKTLTDLANALVPLATAAKQDTLAGLVSTAANQTALQNLIGSLTAVAVTDPTASATLIQLLKGLLKQLQGAGTGAAPVQLTGSNMELYGKTLDDRPEANTVMAGTTFTIVDDRLDQNWISDGTDWLEV